MYANWDLRQMFPLLEREREDRGCLDMKPWGRDVPRAIARGGNGLIKGAGRVANREETGYKRQERSLEIACCAEVIAACHVPHFARHNLVQDYYVLPQISDQLCQTPSGGEQSLTTNNLRTCRVYTIQLLRRDIVSNFLWAPSRRKRPSDGALITTATQRPQH